MPRWILIAILVIVMFVAALVAYVWVGFVDLRATLEPSSMEATMAMMALDASAARNAPAGPNPIASTAANLVAGVWIYKEHCAMCHGTQGAPESGLTFYPRAPQFAREMSDMSPNQNFYIIKNGIRWTGMPAWDHVLTGDQIWTVVAFLDHIHHLPAEAQQMWAAPAR